MSTDEQKSVVLPFAGVVKGPLSVYRFHPGNLMKSVNNSPELIYGNLDHLVAPYLFAKGRFTPAQLAIFRKNTRLDRYVGNSLLRLAHYSWHSHCLRRQEIASKIPEVMHAISSSPRYRMKLLLARIRGLGALLAARLRRKPVH